MRPVDKSLYTENENRYEPYGDAKDDLIAALGPFCSYCERHGYSSALDVEHIEDKHNNVRKKYDWDNFLLACKNCNPIKGTKPIDFDNILLPHLDDTFSVLSYLESGLVEANKNLSKETQDKTMKLIELVGLDRIPGHPDYSYKDKRWKDRMNAWNLAVRYRKKYSSQKCDIDTIIDLAKEKGFWSVWMTVFDSYADVKNQLVMSFKGTRTELFI